MNSVPTTTGTNDVDVHPVPSGVSPSPKPKNDDHLPPWLAQMIEYLRGVHEDAAWQNLVTDFVDFEKLNPPNGVSFNVSYHARLIIIMKTRTFLQS
jgi:hypothetical protein